MKKFFTLIATALMALGVNAQGSYGLQGEKEVTGTPIPAGTQITSVENIVMTFGDAGAADFEAPAFEEKLKELIGATAYTKGNGTNGNRDNGTIYYFEPSKKGTITVGVVVANDKTILVKKDNYSGEDVAFKATEADGTTPVEVTDGQVATKLYGALIFDVEAGVKYAVGLAGSKMGFYGFKYEVAGGDDTPTGEAETWKASALNLDAINASGTPNTTATLKKVEAIYNLKDGAQPTEEQVRADATSALELNDYIFTGSTTNVTLVGVSTPNTGTETKEIWKFAGNDNQKLNSTNLGDETIVDFDNQYVVAGNGNPSLEVFEYYFTDKESKTVGPRYYETYWTPGCNNVPLKGCYYKFTSKSAGKLVIGFFLNKNLNSNGLYIVDGTTKALVAKDKIAINAFRNNCNYEVEKGSVTKLGVYTLNDDYLVQNDIMATDTNRPLYGYLTLNVAANTDYYLFSPKSQMGVYGFQFTATTGIETVKTQKAFNADAPMYNMAGQKVDKSYKGIVIQNGRKFVNK